MSYDEWCIKIYFIINQTRIVIDVNVWKNEKVNMKTE